MQRKRIVPALLAATVALGLSVAGLIIGTRERTMQDGRSEVGRPEVGRPEVGRPEVADLAALARDPAAQRAYRRIAARQAAIAEMKRRREESITRKHLLPTEGGFMGFRVRTRGKERIHRFHTVHWSDYGRYIFQMSNTYWLDTNFQQPSRAFVNSDSLAITKSAPTHYPPPPANRVEKIAPPAPETSRWFKRTPRPFDLPAKVEGLFRFLPPADLKRARRIGTAKVLRWSCKIYRLVRETSTARSDMQFWIWRGLVLRAQTTIQPRKNGRPRHDIPVTTITEEAIFMVPIHHPIAVFCKISPDDQVQDVPDITILR